MLAIIGGTGMTELANLEITHRQVMRTPYGEPSGALTFGTIKQQEVMFLARHGYGHTIPPHLVNYRANLWALAATGVANAALDISDGLIGDLGHILDRSRVGACLNVDLLPAGPVLAQQTTDLRRAFTLAGGAALTTTVGFIAADASSETPVTVTSSTNGNDIDFYTFTLDYSAIQAIAGVNAGAKAFSSIIDLDYADGLARPDGPLTRQLPLLLS